MQTIIQFRLIDKDKNISYISDESIKRTNSHRTIILFYFSYYFIIMLNF